MENINENKNQLLTAYSFLAALNENGGNIYDKVYLPLCKRAISYYAQRHNSGKAIDIQELIKEQYGIQIPIVLVRKLIETVQTSLSRSKKTKFDFQAMEGGDSFSFQSFIYSDLEEHYQNEKRDVNALQSKFEEFVKQQNIEPATIPSFSSFISKHTQSLSAFFSGKVEGFDETDCEESYILHIRFLQYVEQYDNDAHRVLIRILIGSIIASYLESEVDLNAKLEKGIIYYLDTKIVLQALDLQRAEDTMPIIELLKLIQETGGSLRILDITFDELQTTIQTAIQRFNNDNPTTTINEACVRQKKNKTWLVQFKGQLATILKKELNIEVETLSDKLYKTYISTEDTGELKKIWYRKLAAEHDVAAYLYVRDRRKSYVSNSNIVQKAMCWFVTPNLRLYHFNMAHHKKGTINEIVMPEELTSLLFLKNPTKLSERVAKIGLGELIAQTLSEEYPSKELICEFSAAIKNSGTNLTQEQYELLMCEISHESTLKIQKMLDDNTNKAQFDVNVLKLLAQYETKQKNNDLQRQKYNEQQEKEREQLQNRIDSLSQTVVGLNSKLDEQDKKHNRKDRRHMLWIFVLIGIIIVMICSFVLWYFDNLLLWVKKIIQVILACGGLWSFGSFMLNLCPKIGDRFTKCNK